MGFGRRQGRKRAGTGVRGALSQVKGCGVCLDLRVMKGRDKGESSRALGHKI